jgi:hypothetical protein
MKKTMKVENDWKFIVKEHYPLFNENNHIKGSHLVFKFDGQSYFKSLEIPNKQLMYSQECRTTSSHLVYGDHGTLFEASLNVLLHDLELHHQYTILFDQISILMNTIPIDLLDYIEKDDGQVLKSIQVDEVSPQ